MSQHPKSARFESTQWSEVLLAGDPSQTGAAEALDQLCRKYWFPVYANLRRRGSTHSDAEDLTQAFFAEVLRSNKIGLANRERGRFRSFLLTACNNFVSNVHRHENTQRRGGGQTHVSLDVNMEDGSRRYEALDNDSWTPEQIFDRRWALELVELATQRVKDDYALRNNLNWFTELQPFIAPLGAPPSHAMVAERMSTTVGAVKTAIHRLRKRFGVALQEEVAETVENRDEVKDELKILLNALSGQ